MLARIGTRAALAVIGAFVLSKVTIGPLEKAWAHMGIWTSPGFFYHHTSAKEHPHGFIGVFPGTRNLKPRIFFRIVPYCTYQHLAAAMFPFLVTRLRPWPVIRGLIGAILIVSVINFGRLSLTNFLLRQDVPLWISHDVFNILGFCLGMGVALGIYLRASGDWRVQKSSDLIRLRRRKKALCSER